MSNKTKIMAVVLLSVVAVGAVGAVQWWLYAEIQSAVDEATVDVQSIEVEEIENSAIALRIALSIENPQSQSAELDEFQVMVTYGQEPLGTVVVPKQTLEGDLNIVEIETILSVTADRMDTFHDFVDAFINQEEVQILVEGSTEIHADAFVMTVTTEVDVNKELTLVGANGFTNLNISKLRLLDNTESSLTLEATLEVDNPTSVSMSLKQLSFELTHQESSLGNISLDEVSLQQGSNEFVSTVVVQPEDVSAAQVLVSRFLSDQNTTIAVQGSYHVNQSGLLAEALQSVEFTTVLVGEGELTVDVHQVTISDIGANTINGTVSVLLVNPTIVEGLLRNVLLDVVYEEEVMGAVNISTLALTAGENEITADFVLAPENQEGISDLAAAYLDGGSVSLTIRGSESGNTLSALLAGWEETVVIQCTQSFQLLISEFGIISSTEDTVTLSVGMDLYNPVGSVDLVDTQLDLWWIEESSLVGTIEMPTTPLTLGWNNQSLEVTLVPTTPSTVAEIVDAYLGGDSVTLRLQGSPGGDSILDTMMENLILEFDLPAASPMDIAVISIELVHAETEQLTLNVSVQITNPTPSTVDVSELIFETSFDSQTLGNITLSTLSVTSGRNTYNVTVNFTVTDSGLMTDLLTSYLCNEEILLGLECVSAGADLLSNVINDYIGEIQLPAFDIQPQINDLVVTNSSEDTLSIQVNLTLANPTSIDVVLDDVAFDLFYQGIFIGNVTANESLVLDSPLNEFVLDGVLSAEVNRTNLEFFLSNYIGGQLLEVVVAGTVASNFSSLIPLTAVSINVTVSMLGIQDQLVSLIEVQSITVSLSPIGFSATVQATISNPFGFEIDVIDMTYDIYFNDTDGVVIWPLYNYGSKYDIHMASIADDNMFTLPASGDVQRDASLSSTDQELSVRLHDEYNTKHQLVINILNGVLTIRIGNFELTVAFELFSLSVT